MGEKQDMWTNDSELPKDNPFGVPEGYFEMLDDRISERIRQDGEGEKEKARKEVKIIRMVKPLLGLTAAFAIVFMLVHYPLSKFLPWYMSKQANNQTELSQSEEKILATFTGDVDEGTFFQILTSPDNQNKIDSDEIISFLSSELNDYEIYAEITN